MSKPEATIKLKKDTDCGNSWFAGICKQCGYETVVSQPFPGILADYLWYCSNKLCGNHVGKHTSDDEQPDWVNWNDEE
jgi:hypothetical protein